MHAFKLFYILTVTWSICSGSEPYGQWDKCESAMKKVPKHTSVRVWNILGVVIHKALTRTGIYLQRDICLQQINHTVLATKVFGAEKVRTYRLIKSIYQSNPCRAFHALKMGLKPESPEKKKSVTKDGCSALAQSCIFHLLQLMIIFHH